MATLLMLLLSICMSMSFAIEAINNNDIINNNNNDRIKIYNNDNTIGKCSPAIVGAEVCENDVDCNHNNGTCFRNSCVCKKGWIGSKCQYEGEIDTSIDFTFNNKGNSFQFISPPILYEKVTFAWAFVTVGDIPAIDIGIVLEGGYGWVALGIGKSMEFADVMIGSVKDGVVDASVHGEASPTHDDSSSSSNKYQGTNQILSFTAENKNGNTYLRFVRPLCAADGNDVDAEIDTKKTMRIIAAYNGASEDITNEHEVWTHLEVNFGNGDVKVYYGEVGVVHGVLMGMIWLILVPSAIIIARFFKKIGHNWFLLHRAIQSFAFFFTLIAFGLGVNMSGNPTTIASTTNSHRIIGVITCLVMLVQPALGIYADKLWRPERMEIPFFPDYLHWILGYGAMLFAITNIFLGLKVVMAGMGYFALVIVYLVFLLGGFFGKVAYDYYLKQKMLSKYRDTQLRDSETEYNPEDGI